MYFTMQIRKMLFSLSIMALAIILGAISPTLAAAVPRDNCLAEYQCSLSQACNLAAKSWHYCAGEQNDINKWFCLCEYSNPAWQNATTTCFACLDSLSAMHTGIADYVNSTMSSYCNMQSSKAVFADLVAAGVTGANRFQSPISIWDSLWSEDIPSSVLMARAGFAVLGVKMGDVLDIEK